jgi:glyoxylase-like metal-dependent hydrolase (beta-lactamase superfamily II)
MGDAPRLSECSVEIVRGSPATLVVECDRQAYVVDPGHGRKRAKQLARLLSASTREVYFLITHYHSDHLSALGEGLLDRLESTGIRVSVASSKIDAPALRDPVLRILVTFGYPLDPNDPILPFRAPAVRVDLEVEGDGRLGPLELIELPGHTPGQLGALAPDGTLYAADSLFGPRVLERYGIPYHLDSCTALKSLERLEDMISRVERIQPSHGPLLSPEEAADVIEANKTSIERAIEAVREAIKAGPLEVGEITGHVVEKLGAMRDPGFLMLIETTVRGILSCLRRRGEAEPIVEKGRILWRAPPG